MNKKKWILIIVLLIMLIITIFLMILNDEIVTRYVTSFGERIKGALVVFFVVITSWMILAYKLLKTESKIPKENMADRYRNISSKELISFGIEYNDFKNVIYNKFMDITLSFADGDYVKLRGNLTEDLYNFYASEIRKLEKKGYKNIVRDIELLNFKIYDINEGYNMRRISVYLDVMMCDYMVNTSNNRLIKGSVDEKREFEYELIFIKKHGDLEYVMSMKKCINQMPIAKDKK